MKNIDYGKIIKRSWQLTWKNKWLWVVGLVLAAFSGGSSGYSGGSSSNSGSTNFNLPKASPVPAPTNIQNIRNQTSYVLGAATKSLKSWFMGISAGSWIVVILLVILFVIFTTVIVWMLTSWAKGTLITGLNIADSDQPANLKNSSPNGIAKIKDLIVFNLISVGLSLGILIGAGLLFGLGFLIQMAVPVLGIIWLVLFGIVGGLALVVAFVLFSMLTIYAERLIVLTNLSPWEAWKKGLSLGKHNFLSTILMGIINVALGCASGCVGLIAELIVFALPGFLLIAPIFNGGFHFPGVGQIVGIIILLVLFFSINLLIRAVFVVFDTGNWNLLFKAVMEGEKNE